MAKQLVDTTTNNGTHIGDPAKTAFEKVNANFNELYPAALPATEAERAAARGRMGLGTAATRNAQVSPTDATANALMAVGAFGLGGAGGVVMDPNTLTHSQFFSTHSQATNVPWPGAGGFGLHIQHPTAGYATQYWVINSDEVRAFVRVRRAGAWQAWCELYHTGNGSALPITGSLSPATDNSVSYGTAARRPTQLFAATATIGTSDAREKTEVRALTEAEYAVGLQLAREIGAYQWLEAVERKGEEGAREHFGQTVQRAMQIFRDHGLDPFAYGAICYDQWDAETVEHPAQYEQIEIPAVLDEQGNEIEPARYEQGALIREAWTEVTLEAGDRYSWRDSELFWLICAAQQRQADELARQQADILARLEALEQGA